MLASVARSILRLRRTWHRAWLTRFSVAVCRVRAGDSEVRHASGVKSGRAFHQAAKRYCPKYIDQFGHRTFVGMIVPRSRLLTVSLPTLGLSTTDAWVSAANYQRAAGGLFTFFHRSTSFKCCSSLWLARSCMRARWPKAYDYFRQACRLMLLSSVCLEFNYRRRCDAYMSLGRRRHSARLRTRALRLKQHWHKPRLVKKMNLGRKPAESSSRTTS